MSVEINDLTRLLLHDYINIYLYLLNKYNNIDLILHKTQNEMYSN